MGKTFTLNPCSYYETCLSRLKEQSFKACSESFKIPFINRYTHCSIIYNYKPLKRALWVRTDRNVTAAGLGCS